MGASGLIELLSTSLDHTVAIGRALGQLAQPGDVFALDGELGAGKTQFVRGLAQGMGLDPAHVSSPTFVLMHEYDSPATPTDGHPSVSLTPLVHIDAYRVTGPDDLATLGYDDELRDTSVTAVEWARLIASTPGQPLGEHRLHVLIEHGGDPIGEQRRMTIEPHGRWADRLPTLQTLTSLTP